MPSRGDRKAPLPTPAELRDAIMPYILDIDEHGLAAWIGYRVDEHGTILLPSIADAIRECVRRAPDNIREDWPSWVRELERTA